MVSSLPPRTPRREPMFNLPGVVTVSILILVAIHALRVFVLTDETDFTMLIDLAVVPARWTVAWDQTRLADVLRELTAGAPSDEIAARVAFARFVLGDGDPKLWTLVTYALLHGSWPHVLLNSVWLAAFGAPVARRLRTWRFLVLCGLSAIGGALAHILVHPLAVAPLIGASAAVSGLMAASTWFVFSGQPFGYDPLPVHLRPRETLRGLMVNSRALLFVGAWFLANLVFGAFASPLGVAAAGIAWEAHIGGFLVGLALWPALDPLGRLPDDTPTV